MEERERAAMRNERNWFNEEGEEFVKECMDISSPFPMIRTNRGLRRAANAPFLQIILLPPNLKQSNKKSSEVKKRA